jgi:hypothetical protein
MDDFTRKKTTGEPGNPGQFGRTRRDDPAGVTLDTAPPVIIRIQLEQWDANDYAVPLKTIEIDGRTILDTYSLHDILQLGHDSDSIYEKAVDAGIAEPHGGPFTVFLDDDSIADYSEQRGLNDEVDPISLSVPLSKTRQRELYGEALHQAYSNIRTPWVFSATSKAAQANVRAAFKEAYEKLRTATVGIDCADYNDRVEIDNLRNIAEGIDPRGGTFRDQATATSASLADWLLRRDEAFRLAS